MNPTLKKILLAVMIVVLGAAINALVKNTTSKNTSLTPSVQSASQEVSRIKSKCPIKIDDTTSLVDIKLDKEIKKIIITYSVNDDGINYSPIDIIGAKSVMTVRFCNSLIKVLPVGYGMDAVFFNKLNNKVMDLFLDRELCDSIRETKKTTPR